MASGARRRCIGMRPGAGTKLIVSRANAAEKFDLGLAWRVNPHAVNLHVMTVGVTDYSRVPENLAGRLEYASADAIELAAEFGKMKRPGSLFTEVSVLEPLVDSEASAEGFASNSRSSAPKFWPINPS